MSKTMGEDFDRVWRAVIRRIYVDGSERVTFHGPYRSSGPAAAALTWAKNHPWYNVVETTGDVQSSTMIWETR